MGKIILGRENSRYKDDRLKVAGCGEAGLKIRMRAADIAQPHKCLPAWQVRGRKFDSRYKNK